MRSFPAALTLTLLLAGTSSFGLAAKVKVWHHHSPAHHEKAQFKQAVVSNEGTLRLSRELRLLASLNVTHVWDLVEDRNGNLFVATGDEGKIFKVTSDGKVSVAFESEESQVLCLALAADGSIYAGTGPSGLVVRIAPDGNARVLWDSPENYVWSLAVDPKGQTVYAGTGPKGRIYQVTPDGKASIFYTTKQEHILCLAMGPGGLLYAGTDKNGLVYRIDPKGKGFVLFQAPQSEVRSLLVTPDGVYAGTSSPSRRRTGASTTSADPSPGPGASGLLTSASRSATRTSASETANGTSSSSAKEKENEKTSPAPAAPPPGTGENSVFRIAPDGTVREVFREKALVLSLLRVNSLGERRGASPSVDARLFVGTGMEGQLFEVNETTRERTEVARLDHGQIHSLLRRKDGSIVIGTGDPGKLYVLQDRHVQRGTVTSEVHDAKIISRWGSLRWQADTPAGTAVTVAVRTGNVAEPDETWSDWSPEQTDGQQAVIQAPAARYLQYRVTLTSEDSAASPALRSLALRYMTTNQAPEIGSIDVPDLDAVNREDPKKLKFKWTATDPNEDDLTYHVLVRKENWKNWVLLEEGWTKTEYEWDTTTTPSGTYQVRIEASDRKDNPAAEALTGERTSGPFVVSHVPSTVTLKVAGMDGDQAIVEAVASHPLARLTGASFAVNGKKWINVFPIDGLFDSKTETFRFKTDSLKPGTYVVVLRIRDAAGNTGSGDIVFTIQEKPARN